MHIEYSDFDTPILYARLHLHSNTNIWSHRFLRFVENKIPKILTRDTSCSTRERERYWGCCGSATKPIIEVTPSRQDERADTHTHSITVSFIESGLRHIKFQTDFNLILCASGDDKGPGPWHGQGHGRVCYGHNAVSPYFSVIRQITNKGVFATPSSTAPRGCFCGCRE